MTLILQTICKLAPERQRERERESKEGMQRKGARERGQARDREWRSYT
jgi:hypothetical protein